MKYIIYSFLTLLICVTLGVNAQISKYNLNYNVPVFNGTHLEKYAWVGGLGAPQFCPADLNNDGIKDLVIFDRVGLRFYTFINRGKKDTIDYYYAPEYEANMPPSHGWVKFYDYNCDGIPDFFNDTSSTVRGYKGYYDKNGRLAFKLTYPYLMELTHPYKSSDTINLYSASLEMPAFEDVDGDGDMDIINFDVLGYQMLYHRNMAKEKLQRCDTLIFQQDTCLWGAAEQLHWYQRGFVCNAPCAGFSASSGIGYNPSPGTSSGLRHAGNTICLYDWHHKGVKDLLYGNIIFNNITYLHNDGKLSLAHFECETQDTLWPHYNKTANIFTFAAAYHIDIDNDGREDVIVAPNDPVVSSSNNNVWLYKNQKNGGVDTFAFIKDTFLVEDMVEAGQGCNPAVIDVNGDSLLDLVLGNESYYDTAFNGYSALTLYKNIGTKTHPQFKLITRDYLGLSVLSKTKHIYGFTPTFGDIDGNGTIDMIIGYNADGGNYGRIMYYVNDSLPGHNMSLHLATITLKDSAGYTIDVGASPAPIIYDYNNDGLPDLIIGNKSGTLAYYQNVGTKTKPVFAFRTDTFGAIYTSDVNNSYGYSYPSILNVDSTHYLLVGKVSGKVYRYKMDTIFNNPFKLVDSLITNFSTGMRSTVTTANILGSYKPEIFIGNFRGGLQLLSTDTVQYSITLGANNLKAEHNINVRVIPNPAHNNCTISLSGVMNDATLIVYDAFGKVIVNRTIYNPNTLIDMNQWSTGLYFVKICNGSECITRKLVKL